MRQPATLSTSPVVVKTVPAAAEALEAAVQGLIEGGASRHAAAYLVYFDHLVEQPTAVAGDLVLEASVGEGSL